MPVTFAPATRTGAHDTYPATSRDVAPVTAAKLLSAASCSANVDAKARIVRSSIGGRPGPDNTQFKIAHAPGNGFVDTVLCAYTHHHALVIRPDDVWLAVVSQFSFYATAEGNSCSFLDNPAGKIAALEISVESAAAQPDVAKLSRRMTRLVQKIVPDADLRDWLVPEFSTTTLTDVTVSCLLVLSGSSPSSSPTATQTRSGDDADDTFSASCGIPRVTLEGERADWEILLARVDRLKTRCKDFGLPAVAWYHLLHPVLARFVAAFDDPEGAENREFWGGVVVGKEESNGNGAGSKNAGKLSGWITTFCAFSVGGTWLGPELNASAAADSPETLTAAQFWSTYTRVAPAPEKAKPKPKAKAKSKVKKTVQLDLEADSAPPPAPTIVIALADVPPAFASSELELELKTKSKVSGGADAAVNGTATTRERTYTVLAGLVGTGFSSSRDTELSATGRNDTVRPVVAWWIYGRGGAGANGIRKRRACSSTLAPDLDRELDRAFADTAGAGLSVDLENTTSPGAGAGATDTREPESEPVSALAPIPEGDPWSLDLDAPVIPEPPAQPEAPTWSFDDPNPDAAGLGGGGGSDADADAGGWNTASWSAPAPASKVGSGLGFGFGSGFGFGTTPAAVPDPEPVKEPELEAFGASSGQDAPAPAGSESLAEVALEPDATPTAGTGDGGEAEVKSGEEQTQEQEQPTETQTETADPPPPAPEDPEPKAEPEADAADAAMTPAAPTGDGENGDGEDAGDDTPTPAQAAAAGKADGKNNNAGGAKGGKGKKKKKGK
ncbi:hypothetical protein MVEN_00879400 [Mycena venus]|uniref:Uncharacterized protein n=1 Tax=Mycena venus TaxID=2733690 RepID=A0A8H7D1R0_9AGAR|nr:hypothetical protein MVEN_00879400 [Mycena venus]